MGGPGSGRPANPARSPRTVECLRLPVKALHAAGLLDGGGQGLAVRDALDDLGIVLDAAADQIHQIRLVGSRLVDGRARLRLFETIDPVGRRPAKCEPE